VCGYYGALVDALIAQRIQACGIARSDLFQASLRLRSSLDSKHSTEHSALTASMYNDEEQENSLEIDESSPSSRSLSLPSVEGGGGGMTPRKPLLQTKGGHPLVANANKTICKLKFKTNDKVPR
jgi:hypothetical protein